MKPTRSVLFVPSARPRNPLAIAGRRRHAGVHAGGDARQRARRELQRELRTLHPPTP